jgi:hypothetical protein
MKTASDDELLRRGLSAYYRSAAKDPGQTVQPSSAESGVREVDGRKYVVLRNVSGILCVYRVRTDGMLKGLKRWPSALET